MTSGSRVGTYTTPVKTQCSSSDKYGFISNKTWSGADQIPVPKEYVWLTDPITKRRYKKRVITKRRKLDPHNYTMTAGLTQRSLKRDLRNQYPGTCLPQWYTLNWSEAWNCFSPWPPSYPTFTSNDQLKLLSKLQAQAFGSNFDPGVFLAEGKESLIMIADAARKLATSFTHFKRMEFTRAWMALTGGRSDRRRPTIDLKKGISSGWSEFRWGWLPLLNDMQEGAEWLANKIEAPAAFRLQSRVVRRFNAGVQYNTTNGYRCKDHNWTHKRQLIAYLTEPPSTSVLDVINPSTIAWEVLPYSFVIDWAVPIGTYLNVRGLPSRLTGKFVTSDLDLKISSGIGFQQGTCKTKNVDYSGSDRSETVSFTRTVSSSLPSAPRPTFRGFGKLVTWLHAADSLALLTNAFSKRKGSDWDAFVPRTRQTRLAP